MVRRTFPNKKKPTPKNKPQKVAKQIKKAVKKETTLIGKALRIAGGAAGTFAGNPRAGWNLGASISKAFGQGEYSYTLPSGIVNPVPSFGTEEISFCHREFLGNVYSGGTLVNGATVFDLKSFGLNPGLSAFPFLSQIASSFTEYEWQQLVFTFRSMSANALNSTNTALGSLIMVTNYNANEPNFPSKIAMESYEKAVSAPPSCTQRHEVECKRKYNPLHLMYVRTDTTPVQYNDARLSDLGTFQIATEGMQASNVNLGELWVSYRVRLAKPKLTSGSNINNLLASIGRVTSGIAAATPMGTSVAVDSDSSSLVKYFPAQNRITISRTLAGRIITIQAASRATTAGTVPNYNIVNDGTSTPVSLWNQSSSSYTSLWSVNDSASQLSSRTWCWKLGIGLNGQDPYFTVSNGVATDYVTFVVQEVCPSDH